jgi:hypothetical protein
MSTQESFSSSTCQEQMHAAQRELSAFFRAVTEMFGPEAARLSAADWLEECELMDSPPSSTGRNWRAVTIAASARLANRVTASNQPNPGGSNISWRTPTSSVAAQSALQHRQGSQPAGDSRTSG